MRLGQGVKKGGRRINTGLETLGVRGDDRGCKSPGVAHESPGVVDEGGGCEDSGVAENPRGRRHGGGGGVKLPQDANTPIVTEEPWGDKTPKGPTSTEVGLGEDGRGVGEGMIPHPPPEQPGHREPTAAAAGRWAGKGRWSRQARRKRWRTTAARGPSQGNLTALMAPGPSTARLRAASMTYWHPRRHREVKSMWGPPVARPSMGAWRTRRGRKRRRRGTKPCSARSLCESTTEARTRQGDFPKGRAHLTRAATRGGGGAPSSARPQHSAGAQGGPQI